ncbi:MAG: hypothetical protein Q9195_004503 [Heterodermia aff. obscurata]
MKSSLFPRASEKEKETILKYIEQSDTRVPTMELMISEMNFFYSIAKNVSETLKTNGNGLRLDGSQIKKDRSVEVDRKTYLLHFLQAAQHANVKKAPSNVARLHGLQGPTTKFRKVNETSEIWENGTPAELFNENLLRTLKPHYIEGQLPVCLLVMDFLESFFGFSVSQCLTGEALQDRISTLSARPHSFNTHTDRSIYNTSTNTSSSTNDYSSHGSQFILTPFSEIPKISDHQRKLRSVVLNNSPNYKSQTTYIERLRTPPKAHLIERSSVRDTLDKRKQDVKEFLHQEPPFIHQDTESCASTIVGREISSEQSIYSNQVSPKLLERGNKEYGPFLPKRVKKPNRGSIDDPLIRDSPSSASHDSQVTLVDVQQPAEWIAQNHESETLLTIQEDKILRVRIKRPAKKPTVGQPVVHNDKSSKTSVLTTMLRPDPVSSLRAFVDVQVSQDGDKLTSTWERRNKL